MISRPLVSSIRYCAALDSVLSGHVTDLSSSSEQKHLFHRFLSLSVSSGKFQVSPVSLSSQSPPV